MEKMIKEEYKWNCMYNYIIDQWDKMDKTKPFKDQFHDKNLYITEFINEDNHLLLLKYNLYENDIYINPSSIYREARSLVIDLNLNNIVLCPYKKFFNINEIPETNLSLIQEQIKKADLIEISNKLDGSMQNIRWYNNQLIVAGSSALDVNKSIHLQETQKMLTNKHKQLCINNNDYTFIFELISDKDRHIVNYNQNNLYLIGARNVYNGKTLSYKEIIDLGKKYEIDTVNLELLTLDECLSNQNKFKAKDKEGWVIFLRIKDEEYRYKLKCDDYVQIHRLLFNFSPSMVIEMIVENRIDDLLSKVPITYKEVIEKIIKEVFLYVRKKMEKISKYYYSIPLNLNKKEFALFVQNNIEKEYQPYMYAMYNGKEINLLKHVKYEMIIDFLKEN